MSYITETGPAGVVADIWPADPGQDRLRLIINLNGVRLSSRTTRCVMACLTELVTAQLPVVRLVVTVDSDREPTAATLATWVCEWLRSVGVT